MDVAPESIYFAIYRRFSGVVVKQERSPLRTGRYHRRAQSRVSRAGRRLAQPMLTFHERDFDPDDRSGPEHWEGDLIVGSHNRSAIGTLVERNTGYLRPVDLDALYCSGCSRVPCSHTWTGSHRASEGLDLGPGPGDAETSIHHGSDRDTDLFL